MKKLILMMVVLVSLPITSIAGNVKPNKVETLLIWLNKNLTYPGTAVENKEEGIVYVSFTISENGFAENITIKSGASQALNEEAVETVKKMPTTGLYVAEDPNKEYVLPVRFSIK